MNAEAGEVGEGLDGDNSEGLNGETVNAEELEKQLNGGESAGAAERRGSRCRAGIPAGRIAVRLQRRGYRFMLATVVRSN